MNGFVANLFELWGTAQFGDFSNDMYQSGEGSFYLPIFIILVVLTILVPVIYYYVIDSPRLNRWYNWLLFNFGTALFNFIFSWIWATESIVSYHEGEQPYSIIQYLTLSSIFPRNASFVK